MRIACLGILTFASWVQSFSSRPHQLTSISQLSSSSSSSPSPSSTRMMATTASTSIPSWSDLKRKSSDTDVGSALDKEEELREQGLGSAHVSNRLRKFNRKQETPQITLFRDQAGWCPYCEKTLLLVEEKEIPIKIDLVPMRSYGDKPQEFLQKVPNGLLPAIEVNGQVITESQVIMELLDEWHSPEDGYRAMLPSDEAGRQTYSKLARLERELFSWWCQLLFRPEGGNPLTRLMGSGQDTLSGAMQGFLDSMQKVDRELKATKGPWFFDAEDHPTMIDFVFVSHVERMVASCAHWKGLNLRDPKWKLDGLNAWLEAFEAREPYLALKSDYYTNVKDIPPQYGPSFDGGFADDRKRFQGSILGQGAAWKLPLPFDDELQPLYKGLPLPTCVLKAAGIEPDSGSGSYESSDPVAMAKACRVMAAWKLAGKGINISRFAARGGPKGAQNSRKTFGAELADPYADPDDEIRPAVDAALRVVCETLLENIDNSLELPSSDAEDMLRQAVPTGQVEGVNSSMAYLRDRIGVPRDLPLASARYLRAYLNWGIDTLSS